MAGLKRERLEGGDRRTGAGPPAAGRPGADGRLRATAACPRARGSDALGLGMIDSAYRDDPALDTDPDLDLYFESEFDDDLDADEDDFDVACNPDADPDPDAPPDVDSLEDAGGPHGDNAGAGVPGASESDALADAPASILTFTSDSAEPDSPHARAVADAVINALLAGASPQVCAQSAYGGSMLRMALALRRAAPPGRLREIREGSEALRTLRLEALKNRALGHLADIASGAQVPAEITTDEYRAVELRRRTCVSILRLAAVPSARESASDVRPLSINRGGGGSGEGGGNSNSGSGLDWLDEMGLQPHAQPEPSGAWPAHTRSSSPIGVQPGTVDAPADQAGPEAIAPDRGEREVLDKPNAPGEEEGPGHAAQQQQETPRLNRAQRRRLERERRRQCKRAAKYTSSDDAPSAAGRAAMRDASANNAGAAHSSTDAVNDSARPPPV